jgi:hypothetical protein
MGLDEYRAVLKQCSKHHCALKKLRRAGIAVNHGLDKKKYHMQSLTARFRSP